MSWILRSHVVLDPLPADWRDQLARRLGTRPRRIGTWAELALHGARLCLDASQEEALPPGALLRVVGVHGPMGATRVVAEQARQGLPLPFTFMQSQPSQTLAALGQHLGWQGDARYVLSRNTPATLQLAQLECGPAGLLVGTVEEDRRTEWWRYTHR
ncbi:hypothetical protein [Piscinibacter sp. HJYY11]|uniref:hypothetical protein n=1 Tax=Piscinibacter sp. HJYY11 TaxID=2801333 RepID=UPI00191F6F99|nr:hypothetical protein [Piscinibacter sp. HJYY11]MBL0730706.1 hypothetical protein [Piscinibacter sp. HJYY11]